MDLVLSVLRQPTGAVGLAVRHVSKSPFSIGRGFLCDMVLASPQRELSGRHCVLELRNGSWLVRDVSDTGTFLNGAEKPIGFGQVAPLRDRDRLRVGPYEFELRTAYEVSPLSPFEPAQRSRGESDYAKGVHSPAPNWINESFTFPRLKRGMLPGRPIGGAYNSGGQDAVVSPAPAAPPPGTDAPRLGSILWNPPARMKVGDRERIEVRIGDAEVAVEQLRAGLRGRGVPEIDRLEVALSMRVVLIADPADFTILALGNADQHLRPGQVVRWDFDATALRSGQRRLRVLVSMRVRIEGRDEVVDLPSYEREIRVSVAPLRATSRYCAKNWQWIAGSLAFPVVLWAAKAAGLLEAGGKYLQALVK